jgi:Outer membrane protein
MKIKGLNYRNWKITVQYNANLGGVFVKKRLFAIALVIAVMMVPLMVVNAEEPSQPKVEELTLDQCLTLAYQNSKQLKMATKSVEIAQGGVWAAEAGLWPTISYTLGGDKYQYPQQVAPQVSSDKDSFGKVSVSQNLYTGGLTSGGIKLAKLSLDSALEDQRKAKQQLIFDVKSAYYQVWLAEQLVKVQQASYNNLLQHYQQIKNFYQVGTKSRYDLLQAEVNYQGVKPQLIQAQNNFEIAKLSLATTIGIDKDRQYSVSDDPSKVQLPKNVELALQDMIDQAYKDRPELRQLKIVYEVNKIQTNLALAGYKPKVNLTGSYTAASADYEPSDWQKSWTLTLGVAGNFFDGFKTPAAVSQAKDTEEKTKLNDSYARDNIRLAVQKSIQDLKGDLETIFSSQANIDLSKENLRLTQARFNAGMSTTMDIMDAELALDRASTNYYTGVSAYLTALANLDLAVGKDN